MKSTETASLSARRQFRILLLATVISYIVASGLESIVVKFGYAETFISMVTEAEYFDSNDWYYIGFHFESWFEFGVWLILFVGLYTFHPGVRIAYPIAIGLAMAVEGTFGTYPAYPGQGVIPIFRDIYHLGAGAIFAAMYLSPIRREFDDAQSTHQGLEQPADPDSRAPILSILQPLRDRNCNTRGHNSPKQGLASGVKR